MKVMQNRHLFSNQFKRFYKFLYKLIGTQFYIISYSKIKMQNAGINLNERNNIILLPGVQERIICRSFSLVKRQKG